MVLMDRDGLGGVVWDCGDLRRMVDFEDWMVGGWGLESLDF